MPPSHPWKFFRAGGFDQVALDTADDLRALKHLDQKLWVALACPVKGNKLSEATLDLVDTNKDGRIRAPEILAAVAWTDHILKDLGAITARKDGLALANIDDSHDEGKNLLASARRILTERGRPQDNHITVADTADARKLLDALPFNGDGVLPPKHITDDDLRATAEALLAAVGGEPDRSGESGLSAQKLSDAWTALTDYEAWWRRAEEDDTTIVPLGDQTAPAVEAFAAVKAKIDDYFTRCDLAAFDPRATSHLIGAEDHWVPVAARTLSRADDQIAAFPLAHIAPGQPLPLKDGLNPAWAARMSAFVQRAVTPLLGDLEHLTQDAWRDLAARFAAYEAWLQDKKGAAFEALGIERVRRLLASDHQQRLSDLIQQDADRKPEADALEAIDRATRYHRDLHTLLDNFVSFRDFYRRQTAIFQAGTLYLDGRACELTLFVEDVAKHSANAPQSFAYLAYLECNRKDTGEKMNVAAAFTNGDSDFLSVGRNGIFYDRDGRDWDATITKVVEQPISIRQAFWAPYKRLAQLVSDQFEKFAADRDKAAQESTTGAVNTHTADLSKAAAAKPADPKAPPAPPADPKAAPDPKASGFDMARYAGIFAAVGLALGFIVSAVTALLSAFLDLRIWQMPLVIAGILLLISGPSMLLAAFKLRKRNLAPILDASGWAINTRARINIPFGASLTEVAALPENARRSASSDPYQDKKSPLGLYIFLGLLVCAAAILWDMGFIPQWLGLEEKPAAEAPAAPPASAAAPASAAPASAAPASAAAP